MLIGRNKEVQRLERAFKAQSSEFIVLYGRRRVGKTFLIREFFEKKNCKFFQATGLQKGNLKKQLSNFAGAMSKVFTSGVEIKPSVSWDDAFNALDKFILGSDTKTIIFLDELPWMATRRSGLLETIDYYWNQYWSRNPKIILIVCGSSASWLIKNIIYNKGGLHNRCTAEIKLEPFTLNETNTYLHSKKINLNLQNILDIYMALGGIPYYLSYVESGLSAVENIQRIIFSKNAVLKDEFKKLFESLFTNAEAYIEIVTIIASKKEGLSRLDLEKLAKLSQDGGRLTQRLMELEQTSFISISKPWGKQNGEWFKVVDEFCLFYLYWVSSHRGGFVDDYWLKQSTKPIYHVWAGYAFEAICHKHNQEIIRALHLQTSAESIAAWRFVPKKQNEQGAQIDLIIDRADNCINVCEIKYTVESFAITKQYAENLQNKINIFKEKTKTKKQIFLSLITANGLKVNQYSNELISGVVILEDLFYIPS